MEFGFLVMLFIQEISRIVDGKLDPVRERVAWFDYAKGAISALKIVAKQTQELFSRVLRDSEMARFVEMVENVGIAGEIDDLRSMAIGSELECLAIRQAAYKVAAHPVTRP